jgi:uncharacterized protein YbjT (DUF2867 family)
MHVLVTGGTGLVGRAAVNSLISRGHTVRLMSRHAERDAQQWEEGVEAHQGSVASDDDVRGAAEGCEAVLHVAGVVDEDPPQVTFEEINVEGTRRMVRESERAGVRRFIYVSSLAAERGSSDYHRSKAAGEEATRAFRGNWLIVRPGNVYGPGDEVISTLLGMVRKLPAVPVLGGGDDAFQPVWVEDVGEALAMAVEWEEPARQALDLAGVETTNMNELLDLLEALTDKSPVRVPVPEFLARAGAGLADLLGVDAPVTVDQIKMLVEGNVIPPGESNALTEVFGITPLPLPEGLARLADTLPEQLPSEGRGTLHRQRYWADIQGSRLDADALFEMVRRDFGDLTPDALLEVGAEPGTPVELDEGATLTLAVPLRGHIQVRVAEIEGRAITCVTIEGHFLAGMIRFLVEEHGEELRFEVRSYTRAADLMDQIGMQTIGQVAQKATWGSVVEEVVRRSGGEAPEGVESRSDELEGEAAAELEAWVEELVLERVREEESARPPGSARAKRERKMRQ